MTAVASAYRVARSEPMHVLTRWGPAARAIIGVLALAIAFGTSHEEADQGGAMHGVWQHTGGTVLLWVIEIGLLSCALWFTEAAFGVVGDGRKAGPRLRSLAATVEILGVIGSCARGVVFALAGVFVIVAAVRYLPKRAGGLDVALRNLDSAPAGKWLLVAAALGLIIFGIYGLAQATRRRT